ncbi:MAG: hypothetical protein ACE5GE_12740 [Phycisphaerae bacterium]
MDSSATAKKCTKEIGLGQAWGPFGSGLSSGYTASRFLKLRERSVQRNTLMRIMAMMGGLATAIGLAGCGDDARLADHAIPSVEVRTVSDGGVELNVEADPKDVAFVLLRAIRDDVRAGKDRQARRAAVLREMDVCDPDYIYELYRQTMGRQAVYSRDDWVYKRVYLWAPIVAHYVGSFDFDQATARSLMVVRPTPQAQRWPGETVTVDLQAVDPQGDPAAAVVVRIWLHKHATGHWRVFQVGFAPFRHLTRPQPEASPTGTDARTGEKPGVSDEE